MFNSHLHYTHEPLYMTDLDGSPTTLRSVSIHLGRLTNHFIPAMLDRRSAMADRRSAIDHLFGSDPSFLGIQSSTLVLGVMERDMSAPGQLGSEEVREDGVNWEHGCGGRSGRLSRGENVDQAR
jgi:hypothetical protein